MKKRLLLLILMLLPMIANADKSGSCGRNLTWTFEESTGTLTIEGIGAMYNYEYDSYPWYKDRKIISTIVIGDGVTNIGSYAFSGCSGLISVTIPNSVTSIDNNTFSGCSCLTSVTIPNSVTSIGNSAFSGCSALKKVIVSDIAAWCGIQFGGESANPLYYAKHLYIDDNKEIKNLVIPNSVTGIGRYAFSGCSSFTSVTIPNSVTFIGSSAFTGCSVLTSVTIPNSVTSIGNSAFSGCM